MPAELPAVVPGPVPPDDRDAWYAPDIRSQYHIGQGVVATVTEGEDGFHYDTREPFLSERDAEIRDRIERRFDGAPTRPRTREEAIERMDAGLPDRWTDRFDCLDGRTPAGRRRLAYHLTTALRAFESLTPLALDERVRIGDTGADQLTVHTDEFAPAKTDLPVDTPHLDRFLGERIDTETIAFESFEVPVTVLRRHLLGDDAFAMLYAVREPDLFPGDEALIETVKERLVESPPGRVLEDPATHVTERARTLIARRLRFGDPTSPARSLAAPFEALARRFGLQGQPIEPATRAERIDDLTYYVVRDLVGDGALTIPIRDPRIRAVEANRVGERVKVVPHADSDLGEHTVPELGAHADSDLGTSRMPTTLSIDDSDAFVGLGRAIAAEGGVELSVDRPAATVSVDRGSVETSHTVHAAVSLPVADDSGAHISIRKQRVETRSPIRLVEQGVLSAEIVAAIWTVSARGGTLLVVGPVDTEPASVLEAHAPFVPAEARPVGIEGPGSPLDLPHETAVSIASAGSDPDDWRGPDPSSARTRDALHPDVLVFSDVSDPDTFSQFGATLPTGRSVFAAARIESRGSFVQMASAAGVSPERLAPIDLVVELPRPTEQRATVWVPEPVGKDSGDPSETPSRSRTHLEWHPALTDREAGDPGLSAALLDSLTRQGAGQKTVEDGFARRVQYVRFLTAHGMTDRDGLLEFLADLRTDEAATIERIQRSVDR